MTKFKLFFLNAVDLQGQIYVSIQSEEFSGTLKEAQRRAEYLNADAEKVAGKRPDFPIVRDAT